MLASCVELLAGLLLLCVYSTCRSYPPHLTWLWIIPLALEVAAIAFFVSLGLATANALNRNIKFAIPFLMQLWIYASPVVYPASLLPQHARWLLAINRSLDHLRLCALQSFIQPLIARSSSDPQSPPWPSR